MEEKGDEVLVLGARSGMEPVVRSVCLAGKLFSERSHNFFSIMDVMKKSFKPKGKLTTRDWIWGDGLIIFSFGDPADRDWVWRNQPWHFDNHLFVISRLTGMEQSSSVSLVHASMWIRVHDIPLAYQTDDVIRSIAPKFGVLECFEEPSVSEPNMFLSCKKNDRDEDLDFASLPFDVSLRAPTGRRGQVGRIIMEFGGATDIPGTAMGLGITGPSLHVQQVLSFNTVSSSPSTNPNSSFPVRT
ncbi:hypothetical protein ACS0TY_007535 [Phlomoides rotata]